VGAELTHALRVPIAGLHLARVVLGLLRPLWGEEELLDHPAVAAGCGGRALRQSEARQDHHEGGRNATHASDLLYGPPGDLRIGCAPPGPRRYKQSFPFILEERSALAEPRTAPVRRLHARLTGRGRPSVAGPLGLPSGRVLPGTPRRGGIRSPQRSPDTFSAGKL
jgi:hypothetical protein